VPAPTSGNAPQAELRGKPASSAGAAQQAVPSRQAAQAPGAPVKGAPRTEIEDLIQDGNKRMKDGDILEARRLYQKAVALGDPEAALAMGRSYDPIYFARIDKKNAQPDAAKAFDWYRKAMDGGASQTARVRIENLQHFLNQ
jgi:TPR repeat protein